MNDIEREIWQKIEGLQVWVRGDERAPHKPLLLLIALARIIHGKDRLISFDEIKPQLKMLLTEYGPPRKIPHPEYPFWWLRTDNLWEVANSENIPLRSSNKEPLFNQAPQPVLGGFPAAMYNYLKGNKKFTAELIDYLLDTNFPQTLHQDILNDLGLAIQAARLVQPRDPKFRRLVLDAYQHQCAVCGCNIKLKNIGYFLIEAAHIKWHQVGGPASIDNGIALCTVHHKALDRGAIAISDNFEVLVSSKLDGKGTMFDWFISYKGSYLVVPENTEHLPEKKFLEWHRNQVYLG
jgi:putative restriction endonuclease